MSQRVVAQLSKPIQLWTEVTKTWTFLWMLCELPAELAADTQPLAVEELDVLATKAAQGGPVSELIVQERRGEA